MNLVYLLEKLPLHSTSIFLAGATADNPDHSWRYRAITYLAAQGFKGSILIPETHDPNETVLREKQVDWQEAAMTIASAVLMWIPRSLKSVGTMPDGSPKLDLPCFTTNVEFGQLLGQERFLYGRPDDAPLNKGLDYRYEKHNKSSPESSLEALCLRAIHYIGYTELE